MTNINDGGPAFPCEIGFGCQNDNMHQTGNTVAAWYGMSLRDHFAGMALGGVLLMIANGQHQRSPNSPSGSAFVAATAYEIADAMLKAREVKP